MKNENNEIQSEVSKIAQKMSKRMRLPSQTLERLRNQYVQLKQDSQFEKKRAEIEEKKKAIKTNMNLKAPPRRTTKIRMPLLGKKLLLEEKFSQEKTLDDKIVLSGNLYYISLFLIIPMLANNKQSGYITIENKEGLVKIFFVKGAIVHCESNGLQGYEAFYHALYQTEGKFKFNISSINVERTMDASAEYLLLEGARQLDEMGKEI